MGPTQSIYLFVVNEKLGKIVNNQSFLFKTSILSQFRPRYINLYSQIDCNFSFFVDPLLHQYMATNPLQLKSCWSEFLCFPGIGMGRPFVPALLLNLNDKSFHSSARGLQPTSSCLWIVFHGQCWVSEFEKTELIWFDLIANQKKMIFVFQFQGFGWFQKKMQTFQHS